MKMIKSYLWFIKESQSFVKGHNPVLVFVKSLWKGIGFCKNLEKWDKVSRKYGSMVAYCLLNSTMYF